MSESRSDYEPWNYYFWTYIESSGIFFTQGKHLRGEYVLATVEDSLDTLQGTLTILFLKCFPDFAVQSWGSAWRINSNIVVVDVASGERKDFKEIASNANGLASFANAGALNEFSDLERHKENGTAAPAVVVYIWTLRRHYWSNLRIVKLWPTTKAALSSTLRKQGANFTNWRSNCWVPSFSWFPVGLSSRQRWIKEVESEMILFYHSSLTIFECSSSRRKNIFSLMMIYSSLL